MKLIAALIPFAPVFMALDPFAQHDDDFSFALKSAIAALSSAVVFLFFWFRASYRRLERKLDERDRQREQLFKRIAGLEGANRMLANCPASACPFAGIYLEGDAGDHSAAEG